MELKDGQIYRWRWADEKRDADRGPYRSYHCRSQIAVVRNGVLCDTYWHDLGQPLDPAEVILTFYADETWPTIREYDVPYYNAADVRSMQHPNASRAPIYIVPGAKRSKDAILDEIDYREERARSEIKDAQRRLELLSEARNLVRNGRLDEVRLP